MSGEGADTAEGVIFGRGGAAVPPAGVGFVTGVPAIGVMRRGTTAATPPMSVAFGGGGADAAAIPAGGVRRRGTIGGGLCDPVPISVLPELATPRGAGGGRDPAVGTGGGRELALAALASARARAASSITARADAGSADASVEWMSPAGAAVLDASAGLATAAGRGGTLGGVEDFGGALASPP
jgi:hypothetical protein